jgi:hypothetical protein
MRRLGVGFTLSLLEREHTQCGLFGRQERAMTTDVIFKFQIGYHRQDLIRGNKVQIAITLGHR